MNIWLISAVFLFFIGSVSSQLTTWDNQLFDFGWTPYDPTIARCSKIAVGWSDRTTANPASTPPYTISVLCGGYKPILIATVPSLGYNWTVGLPTGGPYILSMHDANGYTGGDSLAFTITDAAAGTNCSAGSYDDNSLQLVSTGSPAECSALVITATGGTAPYTMQIIGAQRPPKTTTWETAQMSYTIDMQPSEQFFVLVTDANGLVGVDGIHTVVNGETGCYNLATTVSAGSLPTTLSYNPSSTVSFPGAGSTSALGSSLSVIANTATTTIVSTVTAADGSKSTLTLPPGASATIAAAAGADTTTQNPSPIPAIVGGAVGGAVLILFFVILFLWWRRRAARVKQARKQEIYDRRRLSGPPQQMPLGATYISPYTPPTPGRDTAPLMGHMNSAGSTGSGYNPAPSTPMSYFGGYNNLTTPGREEPAPWTIPATSPVGSNSYNNSVASPGNSNSYNNYGAPSPSLTESASMTGRSASGSDGLPPGAMLPRVNTGGRMVEKATFVPTRPAVVAPPPYSQGT